MRTSKRKILSNTAANTASLAVQTIVVIVLLPVTVGFIGKADYGLYIIILTFLGYFKLLDLGVSTSLTKYIAEFDAKGDRKAVNGMLNSAFLFYLAVGAAIATAMCIFGTFLVGMFDLGGASEDTGMLLAYMVAVGVLSTWTGKCFNVTLMGLQRYDIGAIVNICTVLANAGATVVLLYCGYGIVELVLVNIIISALSQIPLVFAARRLLPYLDVSPRHVSYGSLIKTFRFSGVALVIQLVTIVIFLSDRMIIGILVGVAAVTVYQVSRQFHDAVMTAATLPSSALLPAASELKAKRMDRNLEQMVLRGSKYKCAVVMSIAVSVFFLAGPLVDAYMAPAVHRGEMTGDDLADAANVARLLVLYWFVFAAWGVLDVMLLAVERFRPILVFNLLLAASYFTLAFTLTPGWGGRGMALAISLPYMAITPFVVIYSLRVLGIPASKYAKNVVLPNYPIAATTGAMLFLAISFFTISGFAAAAALALAGIGAYLGLFYLFGLEPDERRELMGLLAGITGAKRH